MNSSTNNLTVTASVSLGSSVNQQLTITKVDNNKIIILYNDPDSKVRAQIVNIGATTLSLGAQVIREDFNYSQTIFTTPILALDGSFYSTSVVYSGFNAFIGVFKYQYDAVADTITINPTPILEPTGDFQLWDLSYYRLNNLIIASGQNNTNQSPIVTLIDFNTSTFTPQILDTAGFGNYASSAIDEDGDIVVIYNDNNDGVSIYGRIGNIVTNLDPTKRIGVASETVTAPGTASVIFPGSVVESAAGGLTPNQSVFVSEQNEISSVTSFNAINIGRALSTTEYILN